jgi:general stress protein 26
MSNDTEIEAKFWKALKSDRTFMLGLAGREDGLGQPMTAQTESDGRGPIYIFTSRETDLAHDLTGSQRATAHFASKGHDLFANLSGELTADNDRATIDRLWSPFVAAWFEGGKDDPNLLLLRFDADELQVWLNENSVFAGIRMLLGRDPKKDYGDTAAQIRL